MASTADGLLPTSSTTTTNINPFLYGTLTDVLGAAKTQVNSPYQAYEGQRVAQFSPDEIASQNAVRNAQGATMPLYNQATGLINQGAQGLAGVMNNPNFSQSQINQYLNPYTQNVVDSTTNNMLRANQIQQNQLRSSTAGAYGGSRQAILEAENDRNMQDSLGTVTGNLMNQGYQSALSQLNTDRGAQMDAAKGLVSSGSTLGETATGQQAATYKDINALAGSGQDQRNLAQSNLDLSYQDFLNQKNYNKDQLAWLNSMLSGVNLSNFSTGQSEYKQPVRQKASGLQNALGAASTIGGIISNIFGTGKAEGGLVKAYAEGGPVKGRKKTKAEEELLRQYLEAIAWQSPRNLAGLEALFTNPNSSFVGSSGNPTPILKNPDLSQLGEIFQTPIAGYRGSSGNPTIIQQEPTAGDRVRGVVRSGAEGITSGLEALFGADTIQPIDTSIDSIPTVLKKVAVGGAPLRGAASAVASLFGGLTTRLERLAAISSLPADQVLEALKQGLITPDEVQEAQTAPTVQEGSKQPPLPKPRPKKAQLNKLLEEKTAQASMGEESPILEAVRGIAQKASSYPTLPATPENVGLINWNPAPSAQAEVAPEVPEQDGILGSILGALKGGNYSKAFDPNPMTNIGLEILASEPDPYNPLGQYAKATSTALEKYEAARKSRNDEARIDEATKYQQGMDAQKRKDTLEQQAVENARGNRALDIQEQQANQQYALGNARIGALKAQMGGQASQKMLLQKLNTVNTLLKNPEMPEGDRASLEELRDNLLQKVGGEDYTINSSSLVNATDAGDIEAP